MLYNSKFGFGFLAFDLGLFAFILEKNVEKS